MDSGVFEIKASLFLLEGGIHTFQAHFPVLCFWESRVINT